MVIILTESQILEVKKSSHFKERFLDRIVKQLPENYKNQIYSNIEYISKFNIPDRYSIAVKIVDLDKKYSLKDGSNGNEVWAIIRGNTITTIALARSSQTNNKNKFRTDRMFFNLEKLHKFVDNINKIY